MEHREYRKLHAEWYDAISDRMDYTAEMAFWAENIEASGQPVLELGSGTGRILIPLLERGYRVVGLDTSEDMIARCLARCRARGLRPEVYERSMLDFSIPVTFGTVILGSGGLGLFTSDDDLPLLFARVKAHLRPGGTFLYGYSAPPDPAPPGSPDNIWGPWQGDWTALPDGGLLAWRRRMRYHAATGVWESLFILEKYVDGRLVETEANDRTGRYFTTEQAAGYAAAAGFEDVTALEFIAEETPGQRETELVIRCKTPAE